MNSLRSHIDADHTYLTTFRRELHQHPELMYDLPWTSGRVQEELEKAGLQFAGGLAGGTGILGYLGATQDGGKTVALRADMDALPIHEETGLEYASKTDRKMHACGHDGHTAILLGVVRALIHQPVRQNDVLFVFQPAEEGGAGADRLVKEGILEGRVLGKPVDVIYGLHGNPWIDQGHFSVRTGPMMAAAETFKVTITGQGGHAAMPHRAVDPVIALTQVVSALQSIASRNVSPLDAIVISVTTLEAGNAHNVIPDQVEFGGTMRTLLPETRSMATKRFHEIVEGVAASLGCKAHVEWLMAYPVTMNDPWATDRYRQIAGDMVGDRLSEEAEPTMGGEDFSFYGYKVPACFYYSGLRRSGDDCPAGLHTPRFDFNDAVIPDCVEMMSRLALGEV